MTKLLKWLNDEDGQGMVEYGLIVGFISVVVAVLLFVFGTRLVNIYTGLDNALATAEAGV